MSVRPRFGSGYLNTYKARYVFLDLALCRARHEEHDASDNAVSYPWNKAVGVGMRRGDETHALGRRTAVRTEPGRSYARSDHEAALADASLVTFLDDAVYQKELIEVLARHSQERRDRPRGGRRIMSESIRASQKPILRTDMRFGVHPRSS